MGGRKMNERIQELAEQATCDIKDEFGFWIGSEIDKEKFAELIVKECIKVLDTNHANLTLDAKWDAIYEIEQYFGVDK